LTVPDWVVATLGLPYYSQTTVTLADGSSVTMRIHKATIDWDGQIRSVFVLVADGTPLAGMALLHGNRVTLEVMDGGSVTIEPLP
jgi:predicted aspartyl protease